MKLLIKWNTPVAKESIATSIQVQPELTQPKPTRTELTKTEIRQQIDEALRFAQTLPPADRVNEIRRRLSALQNYCATVNKKFIFVEQIITCDRFCLAGSASETATLFRGPKEDASVAICVTQKGSLLYRNSSPWCVYRNEGDILM